MKRVLLIAVVLVASLSGICSLRAADEVPSDLPEPSIESPFDASPAAFLRDLSQPSSFFNAPGRENSFAPGSRSLRPDMAGGESNPGNMRDYGFLIEEGFNQPPDEIQHIFNWVPSWNRAPGGHSRSFSQLYTMEIPLWSQAHQFSFTTQFLDNSVTPNDGPTVDHGGVGDSFVDYRYQLLGSDEFLWCAPRFTLVIPSGDDRLGLGSGQVGYQFNLPVSRYGRNFDYHLNLGATWTPDALAHTVSGAPILRRDFQDYNLGGTLLWKPRVNFHLFTEVLALWSDSVDAVGNVRNNAFVYINPGVRYAVCQLEEVEWVVGTSVPVGATTETPDISLFLFMAVEHSFINPDQLGMTARRTGQ